MSETPDNPQSDMHLPERSDMFLEELEWRISSPEIRKFNAKYETASPTSVGTSSSAKTLYYLILRRLTDYRICYCGGSKYAVRSGSCCLSTTGQWVYEPSPSNRDAEFLRQHRFATKEEAFNTFLNFYETQRPELLATLLNLQKSEQNPES